MPTDAARGDESAVAEFCVRWELTRTPEPTRRGYGGLAVFVTRADGTPAVLKITTSARAEDVENAVLAAWGGRHAARLLERDDVQRVRLLERLGPQSLAQLADPVEAMAVGGDLARKLAIAPPPGLPRMADFAPELAAALERAGTSAEVGDDDVRRAVNTYRTLGTDQPDTLLHGDLQGSNVLRTPTGAWAAIDPLGLVGELAVEALTLVHDRWSVLPTANDPRGELHRWLRAYAEAADVPLERVIDWTHARCVRTACAGVTDDDGLHAFVVTLL